MSTPQGTLPETALDRLRQAGSGHPVFTSDLSVNEFVLVHQAGFDPVGLVVGSSVYHIGLQVARWGQSQELGVLSQAMYQARELAMARMDAEADALGADGVVGVRLDVRQYPFGADVVEFIAVGTAVRARDGRSWRTAAGRPFTSDLSGQDFWTLVQHGFTPVQLVLGTCVYHVAHATMRQMFSSLGQNVELPNFTQAIYDAREIAMARMQAEGQQCGADGIVGVRLTESTWIWGEHAIEFFAVGTAVRRAEPDRVAVVPTMVMPLTG